jgi:hypothetical protein
MSLCHAVFEPIGSFSLTGMKVAAEDTVDVAFRLTKDATCATNTSPALQPKINVLRRNCDGSVRRGASPNSLDFTTAQCTGAAPGVYKASVNAPFLKGDACFAIHIVLADGISKMAILRFT